MPDFTPRTVLYRHMDVAKRPEPVAPEALAAANATARQVDALMAQKKAAQTALDSIITGCDHSAFYDIAGPPTTCASVGPVWVASDCGSEQRCDQ